jgi:hypothetical protein
VPYQRATDEVWIRLAAATVEVFYKSKRCASHVRSFEYGGTTTDLAHMPTSHRKYAEESDASFEEWATEVGPNTLALVRAILIERPHLEHGLRSCRGLKTLERRYARDRIEAACGRALVAGARSYTNVESILKRGLDQLPLTEPVKSDAPAPAPTTRTFAARVTTTRPGGKPRGHPHQAYCPHAGHLQHRPLLGHPQLPASEIPCPLIGHESLSEPETESPC